MIRTIPPTRRASEMILFMREFFCGRRTNGRNGVAAEKEENCLLLALFADFAELIPHLFRVGVLVIRGTVAKGAGTDGGIAFCRETEDFVVAGRIKALHRPGIAPHQRAPRIQFPKAMEGL